MKKRIQALSPADYVPEDMRNDVKELVDKTVVEEAVSEVWALFEKALSKLDTESVELIQQHYSGKSAADLAQSRGLTTEQAEAWLRRVKRELVVALRGDFTVRH